MFKKNISKNLIWLDFLENKINKKYFYYLVKHLTKEYKNSNIFPQPQNNLCALDVKFKDVKVIILSQNPYYKKNFANSLSLTISNDNNKISPSLKNIFLKLQYNLKYINLSNQINQGVLLLNTILTVKENKPTSHSNIGCELFTNTITKNINKYHKHVVFLLWGTYAKKRLLIDKKINYILETTHLSPFFHIFWFFWITMFFKKKKNTYLKNT